MYVCIYIYDYIYIYINIYIYIVFLLVWKYKCIYILFLLVWKSKVKLSRHSISVNISVFSDFLKLCPRITKALNQGMIKIRNNSINKQVS